MINDNVIKEIYKKFRKPMKRDELNLPYFKEILAEHNPIDINEDVVEIAEMDQFSPFRRFLIRSLNAVIEFESMVAFVFKNHIVFLNKDKPGTHIHLKPEDKKRLFGIFPR